VDIANFPSGDVLTQDNTWLFNASNTFIPVTSLSQSGFRLSTTVAAPHGFSLFNQVKSHSFFVCRGRPANYYPGNYLYNVGLRRNSVTLDVNVEIPAPLAANPILNETANQRLDISSIIPYKTNSAAAVKYTRVFDNKPNSVDDWEFSDGGYIPSDPNIFTTRTPSFIAFGALEAGGASRRVPMMRLRQVLTAPNVNKSVSEQFAFVDLAPANPTFYLSNGVVTTTNNVFFFSFETSDKPGISLSAVVELMTAP
jgi:hypothetical protein